MGYLKSSRKSSLSIPSRLSVRGFGASLAVLLASGLFLAHNASAQDPSTVSSPAPVVSQNTSPLNGTIQGQMMAMQQAAMQNAAQLPSDPFQGNVPKSTSMSANFGWMDTFDNSQFNGGYGGGVTVTHWVTSKFALTASIEIESFGLNPVNNYATSQSLGQYNQSGTPVIPITLGGVYDFTGGKSLVNPQIFLDGGPAVTLNGETMPLYFDAGAGVTAPLAKLSDTLAGIDLFANIRVAYLDQMGGALSETYTNLGHGTNSYNNAAMWFMPIEFGATFVF